MQITTKTNPYLSTARATSAPSAPPERAAEQPRDTVSFGSRTRLRDAGGMVLMTAAGFVPVVGTVSNFIGMVGTGLNDKQALSYLSLAGAGANLVGTGSLVGGLITGNSLATNIGLGMLGVSGLAAGVTALSSF